MDKNDELFKDSSSCHSLCIPAVSHWSVMLLYMLKFKTLWKHVMQLKGISLSFRSFCSPEDLELALKENSMPYLLGVRNGMLSSTHAKKSSMFTYLESYF